MHRREMKRCAKFILCERFHCILQMLGLLNDGMMELLRQFITDFDGYFDTLMNWTLHGRPIPDRILEAVDWSDRSVQSRLCDCSGRWRGVRLVVQFGSPSAATSGSYYKHIPHRKGGWGGEDNRKRSVAKRFELNWTKLNRSVELIQSEYTCRSEEQKEMENRTEQNRKNNNKFLIVKNAFVLMPRKTHRKLTGWLRGAVAVVVAVAAVVAIVAGSGSGSSSHLSTTNGMDTHPHVYT